MNSMRASLLASAATLALGGSAYAADMGMPTKAPAPPAYQYATWQGFYIGGNVGVARMDSSCGAANNTADYFSACSAGVSSNVAKATGPAAGFQIGYDWQDRSFVYGVAADWSWTNLKHSTSVSSGSYAYHAQVQWLASFRGRAGLAVDSTMVYFTGGLALGGIKASTSALQSGTNTTYSSINEARVGWVAGVGIEHKFSPQWSTFAEVLYYDFGNFNGPVSPSTGGSTTFNVQNQYNFQVTEGRVGINYHF
jgi:outer membrane immunogenic protein